MRTGAHVYSTEKSIQTMFSPPACTTSLARRTELEHRTEEGILSLPVYITKDGLDALGQKHPSFHKCSQTACSGPEVGIGHNLHSSEYRETPGLGRARRMFLRLPASRQAPSLEPLSSAARGASSPKGSLRRRDPQSRQVLLLENQCSRENPRIHITENGTPGAPGWLSQ